MILLALLSAQAPVALTLSRVRQLSPAAAGELILHDRQHGPIETFEAPTGGMNAPGMIDRQLTERPVATGPGCARTRWTVKFRAEPNAEIDSAKVTDVYPMQEIALAPDGICPSARYVYLNHGIALSDGWQALAKLKGIGAAAVRVKFRCTDTTTSDLCKNRDTIHRALDRLTPWAITRDGDDMLIWLGEPGQIVTEVRFSSVNPSRVIVDRRIPAPF